jgi:fructose-1,6-bisphosphatase/inositol monophosphatase family enzyme
LNNNEEPAWLQILRKAALAGRRAVLANYDFDSRTKVVKRGAGGDETLKIDAVSEAAIYSSLTRDLGRGSFAFLSEEMGESKVENDEPKPIVICDPLDGSHNAQVGIPLFSISLSVAGLHKKIPPSEKSRFSDIDVALIASIPTDDEFTATRGRGAFHNETLLRRRREHRKPRSNLIKTLGIECGDMDYLKTLLKNLSTRTVYKTRILGSAAISLALLAEGTLDALIFAQPSGARTIDSHAGFLIATEAGCLLSDLTGKVRDLGPVELGFHSRINIVGARTKSTHDSLLKLVKQLQERYM